MLKIPLAAMNIMLKEEIISLKTQAVSILLGKFTISMKIYEVHKDKTKFFNSKASPIKFRKLNFQAYLSIEKSPSTFLNIMVLDRLRDERAKFCLA